MEMAQEEDEKKKESATVEKEISLAFLPLFRMGAWGSQGSSRAPVIAIGMIANGFADLLDFNIQQI